MQGFDGRGPRGLGQKGGLGSCGKGLKRGQCGFFGKSFNFLKGQTFNNQKNIDKEEQKRMLKMEIQKLEDETKYLAKQLENLEKN